MCLRIFAVLEATNEFSEALLSHYIVFSTLLYEDVSSSVINSYSLSSTQLPSLICKYKHLRIWVVLLDLSSILTKLPNSKL